MGKRKKKYHLENPNRNDDIKRYREMGNTMEKFTDSVGNSYIVNIPKRMISKGGYNSQELQEEVHRRLNNYVMKKLEEKAKKEETQNQAETGTVVE